MAVTISMHLFPTLLLVVAAFFFVVDGQASCQDKEKNCASYSKTVCNEYKAWAKSSCAKTCGLCIDPCSIPCRKGLIRRPDCSCTCKAGYVMMNSACVCRRQTCAWNEMFDDSKCQCVDKPCQRKSCAWNQQFDLTKCQCVQKPCTNQCPSYSTRLSDCTCQCSVGYVLRNNACVAKSTPCPSGWKHYYGDQTCLQVIGFRNTNNRITWYSAKNQCQYFKGSLVIIRDEYKNAFVKGMVPKDEVVWIGLRNVAPNANDFKFQYVDNSYPGDYHPWTIDNPDNYNGQERCVTLIRSLWDGYWNDLDCGVRRAYVCQIQATQSG